MTRGTPRRHDGHVGRTHAGARARTRVPQTGTDARDAPRHGVLRRASSKRTHRANTGRRGIMPNGQIAGCDAVVERTAAHDAVAVRATPDAAALPPTAAITVDGVAGVQPAIVAGRPLWRLRWTRGRRRRFRSHRTQEHRAHVVASRQTGTCSGFFTTEHSYCFI